MFATIYFFSYTLIISMVFLRLFIAIILQSFQETAEHDSKFMNNTLTNKFRDVWAQFDPDVNVQRKYKLPYRRRASSR